MATKKTARSQSNGRLDEALAILITNQAHFIAQQASADERFRRIENELAEIKAILREHQRLLMDHQRILEALPEAVRQKIGFTPP